MLHTLTYLFEQWRLHKLPNVTLLVWLLGYHIQEAMGIAWKNNDGLWARLPKKHAGTHTALCNYAVYGYLDFSLAFDVDLN